MRESQEPHRLQRAAWWDAMAVTLLVVVALAALLPRLAVFPPTWLDEGQNMHAARTLAERGVYGTSGATGIVPFDPQITTGPTQIVLMALSFKMLGCGLIPARLVAVFFAVVAVVSLYTLALHLYGRSAALFCALFVLALPSIQGVSVLRMGRQALGEAAALAMLLIGSWCWFTGWRQQGWRAAAAGLAFALALLAKLQLGITLFPTLLLIAGAGGRRRIAPLTRLLVPVTVLTLIVGGWITLQQVYTPVSLREGNWVSLHDVTRTLLITGLLGGGLSRAGWLMFSIMGLAAASTLWRLRRAAGPVQARWAEITLALFVVVDAVWFALISVGWPRYAFIGFEIALLLISKAGWDLFESARQQLSRRHPPLYRPLYATAVVLLCLAVLVVHVRPVLRFDEDRGTMEMARYIRIHVPREAIIETWEWELDVPSSHWNYHHPTDHELSQAARQRFHENRPFQIQYDLLQADPDYLVTGPLSDWTAIYDWKVLRSQFTRLAAIGAYTIHRRRR